MDFRLEQSTYVVAVSGGVDSVVLLDVLMNSRAEAQFIVAHFDHGIRDDSEEDAEFVRDLAGKYGLPFELGSDELGPGVSEAIAREARYDFLNSLCQKYNAILITAHHQDDLIETAIINLIRGTGPHGIVNMLSNSQILRPLLGTPKVELFKYANKRGLTWREDYTNTDESYLRNYIRLKIMPAIEPKRSELVGLIYKTHEDVNEIDETIQSIAGWLLDESEGENGLSRAKFAWLDHSSASYVIRDWLLKSDVQNINKKLIERVVVAAKTLQPGKRIDLDGRRWLRSDKLFCQIVPK